MAFRVIAEPIPGLLVIESDRYDDERGFFMEVYRADQFAPLGLPIAFPQENYSRSNKNVLRGLHFQWDPPQGKFLRVVGGTAFIAMADIRKGSPTLGQWFGTKLSAGAPTQIWVPPGFANGFCALSDGVEVLYKCTALYNPKAEGAIRWDDPSIGVDWPVERPILSPKDAAAKTLREWHACPESDHFRFQR